MDAAALRLPALEVVARSRAQHMHLGLESFYYRMNRGMGGTFITLEQIELRAPTYTSEMLREAGLQVEADGSPRRGRLILGRTQCAPMVCVDGIAFTKASDRRTVGAMNEAMDAVNPFNPSMIEGIEVYRGAATLPPEFGGSTGQCGVIAIWLKRGT